MWKQNRVGAFALAIAMVLAVQGIAAVGNSNKRAVPPKFANNNDKDSTFYPDVREKLVGARPASGGAAASPTATATTSGGGDDAPTGSGSGSFPWSKLIDAETLEAETKAIQSGLSEAVTTPAKFKGGGYKDGRLLLSMQATVFGIIAEYDGEVRWKKQAAGMRRPDRLRRPQLQGRHRWLVRRSQAPQG